ncbi:MAG: Gfo/Idh/MocA family protein [Chloroflexota bacterium]
MASDLADRSLADPPMRLRIALFGAGLVGQAAHAPTLADDRDRFEFVAVVDPSTTAREAVAARYGVEQACATLEDAIALGLDAVVVAVPDAAHRVAVLTALAAGLHVLCEKPLALTVADVDEILAARRDRVVQCGYMKLYDPAVEKMVELLRGADLVHLTVTVNDPDQAAFVDHLGLTPGRDAPAELVETTRREAREAVAEALGREADGPESRAFEAFLGSIVHDVSLAHHLLGSLGISPPLPLADASYFDAGRGVSLDWALPGGRRAHLEHLNLPGVPDYRERVTAYCRDRILELTFPSPYLRHVPTRLVERRPGASVAGLEKIEHRISYEEAFRNELRAFHAAVTTGAPVRASVEAARDDVIALLAAFRLAADRHQAAA